MSAKNKKWIIVVLIILICIALFFTFFKKEKSVIDSDLGVYSHTTGGKKITIQEAENSVIITTEGFNDNTPTALKKGKLRDIFFVDLNDDGSDEIVLVFKSITIPEHNEAVLYTTFEEASLSLVEMPAITEEEMIPGGVFERYLGSDTFTVEGTKLLRTFFIEEKDKNIPQSEELLELNDDTQPEEVVMPNDTPNNSDAAEATLSSTSTTEAPDAPPSTQRRTITYVLTYTEGFFSLEPHMLEISKQLTASSIATLPSTSWKWLSLNKKGTLITPANDTSLILSFSEDGTFSASTTCEVFAGGYITSGNVLRLGSLVTISHDNTSTCSSSVSALKDIFPSADSFVIRDDQLMITIEQNSGVILFTKQ
jgi:META domain